MNFLQEYRLNYSGFDNIKYFKDTSLLGQIMTVVICSQNASVSLSWSFL